MWLTTAPTTDGSGSHAYTNLAESAQYTPDVDRDTLEAGERSPAMIAAALRPGSATD